jgi:hypothetical protein
VLDELINTYTALQWACPQQIAEADLFYCKNRLQQAYSLGGNNAHKEY